MKTLERISTRPTVTTSRLPRPGPGLLCQGTAGDLAPITLSSPPEGRPQAVRPITALSCASHRKRRVSKNGGAAVYDAAPIMSSRRTTASSGSDSVQELHVARSFLRRAEYLAASCRRPCSLNSRPTRVPAPAAVSSIGRHVSPGRRR